MISRKPPTGPVNIRQPLSNYEPGAHLFAPFVTHWKGGVASLLPFAIIYFTAQPFTDAMTLLTMGGYTIGPAIIGGVAAAWGVMSYLLLHALRFNDSARVHYATYAVVGAVVLSIAALVVITLVHHSNTGSWVGWQAPALTTAMVVGAPLVGALGAMSGRWAIKSGIQYHRWIERKPLPNVFDFVEGKRSKDDFERM